jgi:hypothetical protein
VTVKRSFLLPLIVCVAALAPSTAGAATVHGVVVGKQHGLLLVASPGGVVQTVHATASIGSILSGTHVVGHARRAHLHGIVIKRIGTTMFLSSNHHLLAVHTGRTLASAAQTVTPGPGAVVDTTVGVQQNGELDEQDENEVGQVSGNLQVQATVTAVGAGTVTLSVNGQTLTVNLPAGLTLPSSVVGQTVTINVSLGNDDEQGDDNDNQGDDDGSGGGD